MLWQHDDNNTNFYDDDFKIVDKLLASCYLMLSYHKGIKLPTSKDSIAAILVATHT